MRFSDALMKAKKQGRQIVIPDIKRFSPKDGELLQDRSPAEYAKALVRAGAPVLSVVTEEKEFHGSLRMLREIADAVPVPILRKDFIHTREDLLQTREAGASAILLMCSCLEREELAGLYRQAKELGLDPFVETHRAEDLSFVKTLFAEDDTQEMPVIGINNRDILQLERDDGSVHHTISLIGSAPENAFLVTESSIRNPEEVRMALRCGADAALVGTAIAKAPDAEVFYRMLTRKVSVKICGLMNAGDIRLCVENGAERIGLVTEYPLPVPWNLTAARAKELRKHIPAGYQACMVTGGSPEKIIRLAEEIRPDMVQLHYRETLEETALIAAELKKKGIGVIKTVPVTAEESVRQFGTDDPAKAAALLDETDTEALLADPRQGSDVAKTDLHADTAFFRRIKELSKKPVILAGGITGENIKELLEQTGAEAVDIMNGSETEPGKKDPEKIRRILEAAER